jgi:CBS domain-containing protein
VDPAASLRATPPFHTLPEPLFADAVAHLEAFAAPAGTWLSRAGGEPLAHLYLIRAGTVRLERHGQTVQVLEEGETFGFTSLLTGAAALDVVVDEDLSAWRLPREVFERLLADGPFAGHFAAGLGQRLRSSLDQSPVAAFQPSLALPVGDLVRREAVWLRPGATIVEAARVMRGDHISSVLVRSEPPAILTDRDLRNRVVADGLPGDTPLSRVASSPLRTVAAETPVYEAWLTLLDGGIHHLPVVRRGEIVGVVTSTDLMRVSSHGPMALLRRVERLASRESLAGYAARISEMAAGLLSARIDPVVIAQLVARLNDSLLRTALRWAEADLGPAPAPWAWLSLGSEGRMEQTLITDQDNALVFADEGLPSRGWSRQLAGRVVADLRAAGFPECPGGYMATRWNGPLREWRERFRTWLAEPQPQALLEAAIFFDHRRAAGALDVASLQAIVADAVDLPAFLRALFEQALRFRPPAALLLRMRGESSTVDLKKHGLAPVVLLARCYALEIGSAERGTLGRLEAAERAGRMDPELREAVAEAYRFLLGLRLRLQLRHVSEGRPPGDEVALSELSPVERSRLKESFRAIRGWQDAAAHRYRV